jgi:hypothetical protein
VVVVEDLAPLRGGDVNALRRLAVVWERRRFPGRLMAGEVRKVADRLETRTNHQRSQKTTIADPKVS